MVRNQIGPDSPQPGWTFCSWENTRCAFTGTMEVSYGANGKFTSPRTFTGGVDCNNAMFGDPYVMVVKWCEIRPVSTTTAAAPASSTEALAASTASLPVNTSLPTISGPSIVGKLQKASPGSWSNSPTTFGYTWARCDSNGRNCVAIVGATNATYEATPQTAGEH